VYFNSSGIRVVAIAALVVVAFGWNKSTTPKIFIPKGGDHLCEQGCMLPLFLLHHHINQALCDFTAIAATSTEALVCRLSSKYLVTTSLISSRRVCGIGSLPLGSRCNTNRHSLH
jgi:hypothetical protein